jgi:hypothetical protein
MSSVLITPLAEKCCHRRQSRPLTLGDQTYTVCPNCGKEIGYSFRTNAIVLSRVTVRKLEGH